MTGCNFTICCQCRDRRREKRKRENNTKHFFKDGAEVLSVPSERETEGSTLCTVLWKRSSVYVEKQI